MEVIQRNFRTFMRLRHWNWFSIIQKTRPLIGMINIEEEIKLLENAAESAVKESEKEASEKKRLDAENKRLEEEKKLLLKRIETEQGDLGLFEERMAKASAQKADLEATLQVHFQICNFLRFSYFAIFRKLLTNWNKKLEKDNKCQAKECSLNPKLQQSEGNFKNWMKN